MICVVRRGLSLLVEISSRRMPAEATARTSGGREVRQHDVREAKRKGIISTIDSWEGEVPHTSTTEPKVERKKGRHDHTVRCRPISAFPREFIPQNSIRVLSSAQPLFGLMYCSHVVFGAESRLVCPMCAPRIRGRLSAQHSLPHARGICHQTPVEDRLDDLGVCFAVNRLRTSRRAEQWCGFRRVSVDTVEQRETDGVIEGGSKVLCVQRCISCVRCVR